MKLSMSIKAVALLLALSSVGLAGNAQAYDDDHDGRDAAIGIIGAVVGTAIEAEQAKQEAKEQDRQCRRLQHKCDDGSEWACRKLEENCGD